jgi:hypothetical protein
VLIASRSTQRRYDLVAPDIHPSVPSNSLEVWFGSPELAVLGFRMPAFAAKERALKRLTWNWLLGEAGKLQRPLPDIMLGIVASGEREDPPSEAAQSQPSLPL